MTPFRTLQPEGETRHRQGCRCLFWWEKPPKSPQFGAFWGDFLRGKPQPPKNFFGIAPPKTAFLRGQFFPGYGTVQPEKVLRRCRKPVAVHKTCQQATADSIHKDSIRWSGLQVQRMPKPEPPKKQRGPTERSTPMKEMNRREFLTLSGAAVVALSLAGCGGGTYAPPAPPASESKELALLRAINEVWYPDAVRHQPVLVRR